MAHSTSPVSINKILPRLCVFILWATLVCARPTPPSADPANLPPQCRCPKDYVPNGDLCEQFLLHSKLETCPYDPVPRHENQCLKQIPSGPYCHSGVTFIPKVGCVEYSFLEPTLVCPPGYDPVLIDGSIDACQNTSSTLYSVACPSGTVFFGPTNSCVRLGFETPVAVCDGVETFDAKCQAEKTIPWTLKCPIGSRLENDFCVAAQYAPAKRICLDVKKHELVGRTLVFQGEDYCIFEYSEDHALCDQLDVIPGIGQEAARPCKRHIRVPRTKECPPGFSPTMPKGPKKDIVLRTHDGALVHRRKMECFKLSYEAPLPTCAGQVRSNQCLVLVDIKWDQQCPNQGNAGNRLVDGQCACVVRESGTPFCPRGQFQPASDAVDSPHNIDLPFCGERGSPDVAGQGGAPSIPALPVGNSTDHEHVALVKNRQLLPKPAAEADRLRGGPEVPFECVIIDIISRVKSCPDQYELHNGLCIRTLVLEPLICPSGSVTEGKSCYEDVGFITQCPPGFTVQEGTDRCSRKRTITPVCKQGHLAVRHSPYRETNSTPQKQGAASDEPSTIAETEAKVPADLSPGNDVAHGPQTTVAAEIGAVE